MYGNLVEITLRKKMYAQFMFNLQKVVYSKHILTSSFDNKYSDDILVVNNNPLFHEIYTKELSKTNIINDSCHFMDLDITLSYLGKLNTHVYGDKVNNISSPSSEYTKLLRS
jgi:hypothetical protein